MSEINKMIQTCYTQEINATVVQGEKSSNVIMINDLTDESQIKAFADLHRWSLEQLVKEGVQLPLVYGIYIKETDTFNIETTELENNKSFIVSEMEDKVGQMYIGIVGQICYNSIQ